MVELLKTRRSIRKYTEKEVEQEKLELILKAALLAPSSKGKRPCEFVAIRDKDKLKKLKLDLSYGDYI